MEFNFNKGLDIVLERFLGLKKIWKACLDKARMDKGNGGNWISDLIDL